MSEEKKGAALRGVITHQMSDGRKIYFGQLGVEDFNNIKEEALRQYKRSMLKTWSDNLDLLPPEKKDELLIQKFNEAEVLTEDDLPAKTIQRPARDPATGKYRVNPETGTYVMETVAASYTTHWLSQTTEGMLYAAWLSLKRVSGQENFTKQQTDDLFLDSEGQLLSGELEEAAQTIGEHSESKLAKNA